MLIKFRLATSEDEPVLWEMLTYAASMTDLHPNLEDAITKAKADPYLSKYVQGFGTRAGDVGLIAGEGEGAAWLRLGTDPPTPHAVGTLDEPELAIGLRPALRGSKVGTRLLSDLFTRSTSFGIRLSVRSTNPSVRLYERLGFEHIDTIENRVGGDSLVMRRSLR